MILSSLARLIVIGFVGSTFAMFRFVKYCRLLNGWELEPEKKKRYQIRGRLWLTVAGLLLGIAVLSIAAGIIINLTFPGKRM